MDDEPPAREIIRRYIEQVPTLELAGECANALEAFSFLQQGSADLIFLDIRMPQLSGIDFLKSLKNRPKVIFTTAYTEYALHGYELDVVDYLVKPIPFERFLRAVDKAVGQLPAPVSRSAAPATGAPESFVYFRVDRKMVKVMLSDILYIESMKDYVRVFTTEGMLITKQSLSSVEAMLPDTGFIRVHRSFIVSINGIRSFNAETIETAKAAIPIGKLYKNNVLKILGGAA
ncbi:response regulator transcription factor [Nostoc ellipsosporum NOK]|nr:response regulator transcription factor [Nostoc ellipsosporum NOK]